MKSASSAAAAWLILAALVVGTAAHGGALHDTTPETQDYLRTLVASCSAWQPAAGPVGKVQLLVNSAAAAKPAAPIDVKGSVKLFQYLYKNCSVAPGKDPSASATFNVTLTRAGKLVSGTTFNGMAVTGSCSSGGGKPFYFNTSAEPLDDKHNLLWFHDYTVSANGSIAGNGANDGTILTAAKGGRDPVKAVMLVDAKTGAAVSCCDLKPAGPANTDWAATLRGKGTACPDDDEAPAPKAGAHGAGAAAHDHSGHADHASNATAGAATAKAATAKSGAASASLAAGSAAALAALAALALMA